jgi:hypothetical protein
MREAETGRTVQLLDLLTTFFANEAHWTRGRYHDGWERRCLVGAVMHLSGKHRLPREPVMRVLQDALPRRGSVSGVSGVLSSMARKAV